MNLLIDVPDKLEKKLRAYRDARKAATGKASFRNTAVLELLTMALDGVKPELPIVDRLARIEARLTKLEEPDSDTEEKA